MTESPDQHRQYLEKQIIAYIGNKRRLINLIREAISSCGYGSDASGRGIFFDPFAGSGIVSRLAKSLGFSVIANDWEYYSFVINSAYVGTDAGDIDTLFGSRMNFESLLYEINNLPDPEPDMQYIAKYYAPSDNDIDKADFRKERLFYTRENALRIDRIRNYIAENYGSGDEKSIQAGYLLTGMLLYQAATHTNTSGVFKAYHKGFGGHGKDALGRILKPITLEVPPLIDSACRARIFMEDANVLAESGKAGGASIAYLDPPYNQHQYGSNYHLLNTIARWDRVPAPLETGNDGRLLEKAAIRKDWINTRSLYCCRKKAPDSFRQLLESIDAKSVIVSYSTDGIIPFEEMKEICASRGRLTVKTNEYTKYRGGKQSNSRLNSNIEFVLIIDTGVKNSRRAINDLDRIILRKKINLLLKRRYSLEKLKAAGAVLENGTAAFFINGKKLCFTSPSYFEMLPGSFIDELDMDDLSALHDRLSEALCVTMEEELFGVMERLVMDNRYMNHDELVSKIPGILKKIAHKKTRESFYIWLDRIKRLKDEKPALYSLVGMKIESVEDLARKRFAS